MEKNKELTEIKETKNMETDKTDRAEALSSKIFRVIRHVVAILLSVVVLIWGISVWLDISTIKDRTKLLQGGTPIEKFKITGGNSRLLVSGMKAGFLQDFMYI